MIKTIIKEIDILLSIIDQYQIKSSYPQVGSLKYLKDSLSLNDELGTREKLTIYQELFPPHGGLSDIHYWHNDFETRKAVNDTISNSKNVIADYLLER